MANKIRDGLVRLSAQRKLHMSESVLYKRLGFSVTISATRGSTSYEVADEDGIVVRARSTDFLFATADLVLDAKFELPERGDEIEVTETFDKLTYEVLDLGDAGHYRYSDPLSLTLRVFTKLTKTETILIPE